MSDELPHVRKVGRYLFYGLCSFGFSLLFHAVCRKTGLPNWLTEYIGTAAMFIAFMALRDMEKNADARALATQPTDQVQP